MYPAGTTLESQEKCKILFWLFDNNWYNHPKNYAFCTGPCCSSWLHKAHALRDDGTVLEKYKVQADLDKTKKIDKLTPLFHGHVNLQKGHQNDLEAQHLNLELLELNVFLDVGSGLSFLDIGVFSLMLTLVVPTYSGFLRSSSALYSLELIHALSHQEWEEPWCISSKDYGLWLQ